MLTAKFNLSLGFIPIIATMLLCEIFSQNMAVYLGFVIAVALTLHARFIKKSDVPPIILYGTTFILALFAAGTFVGNYIYAHFYFPTVLEASVLILFLALYLYRKQLPQSKVLGMHSSTTLHPIEAAVVSIRVTLIVCAFHLIVILLSAAFASPLSKLARLILFHIAPSFVFLLAIAFNQWGIYYFNKLMNQAPSVPVVNAQGCVIGKALAKDAIGSKQDYLYPVIRIAITVNGMLFLRPRPAHSGFDQGKTDLPLETWLYYGEDVKKGVHRMLQEVSIQLHPSHLRFSTSYRFENECTNRLVYLFILDLEDDYLLHNEFFRGGKLWTWKQMEDNLNKKYFSSNLEYEFEHLHSITYTREKYRES